LYLNSGSNKTKNLLVPSVAVAEARVQELNNNNNNNNNIVTLLLLLLLLLLLFPYRVVAAWYDLSPADAVACWSIQSDCLQADAFEHRRGIVHCGKWQIP
jgi:hypothetical protein